MSTKTKQKQIVVNVTESSKAQINALKEDLKLSDKEFIDVALAIIAGTSDEVIAAAVENIVMGKQRIKLEARLIKIEAQLAKARLEAGVTATATVEPEEVVYSAADEDA